MAQYVPFPPEERAGWVVVAWRRGKVPKKLSATIETYAGAEAFLELAKKHGERCAWIAFARDPSRVAVLMGETEVADKRIYVVNLNHQNGDASNGIADTVTTRLVNASTPAQAIRHVAKGMISAHPASVNEMAILAKKHEVEDAGPDA